MSSTGVHARVGWFATLLKPRTLLILLAGVCVVFLGWKWLQPTKENVNYLTAKATRGRIEDSVLAAGLFQAQNLVSVGAQTSGEVKKLHVSLGDTVHKGQVIAEIDALTQQNALQNAQAALTSQQAQKLVKQATLKQAMLAWKRQKMMLAQDATSRQEYENSEAALQTAQADIKALDAQIEQAKIAVNTAKLNISRTQITAPINGTVVEIDTLQGQTVNANQTTPTIVKLADLTTLTIKAQISEADVVKVKAGMPVYFTILGDPDHKYNAILNTINPAPETITTDSASASSTAIYYDGLINVPNTDGRLRINMTAQVYIVLHAVEDALIIPAAAIKHHDKNDKDGVRVLAADGTAHFKPITIGLNNRVNAQVLSGLQEGDNVIIGEDGNEKLGGGKMSTSKSPRKGPMGF